MRTAEECYEYVLARRDELAEQRRRKRKSKSKPVLIAALVTALMLVSLIPVNATKETGYYTVNFVMGGENVEGKYYDYVDKEGYRHIVFRTVKPLYEQNYAVMYDVDAPEGQLVRVITEDNDPEFIAKIGRYVEASNAFWESIKPEVSDAEAKDASVSVWSCDPEDGPEPEDFGLVVKDSELCIYSHGYINRDNPGGCRLGHGEFGGEFMRTGAAEGKPSGSGGGRGEPNVGRFDYKSGTETRIISFYYYVGKE